MSEAATVRTLADITAGGPLPDQWAAADTAIHVLDAIARTPRSRRAEHLTGTDVELRDDGRVALVAPPPTTDAAFRSSRTAPPDDVRAVGALLFHMLVGRAPTGADLSDPARAVRTARGDIDAGLATALARSLSPNPATRFRSPADFRAALAALRVLLSAPTEMRRVALPDPVPSAGRGAAAGTRGPWAAVLIVLSLLLAAGLTYLLTRSQDTPPPPGIPVPNVAGLPADQALAQVTAAGLRPVRIDEPSVAVVPGNVIRTSPTVGTNVAAGSEVFVVVSGQATSGLVPTLVGLPQSEAASILSQYGLTATYRQEASPTPAGTVIRQNPAPGTTLTPLGSVELTVSTGPSTTTSTTTGVGTTPTTTTGNGANGGTVQVPNVIGQTINDATDLIDQAGLTLGAVTYQSSVQTPGTVISTNPEPGASVPPGTLVSVLAAD